MTDPTADGWLIYRGEVFINPSSTSQWVSAKLFTLPYDVDDVSALRALTAHVRYRDSYGGTGDEDMVDIHGPYWLSAITPEVFVVADRIDTEALIRDWADGFDDAEELGLEHEVYQRIRRATAIYRLPDLRAVAEHDWGWVVGITGFHEYVTLNRAERELALIVASDD